MSGIDNKRLKHIQHNLTEVYISIIHLHCFYCTNHCCQVYFRVKLYDLCVKLNNLIK